MDVLLTFFPTAKRGLTETIFNRNVDLIVKAALERSQALAQTAKYSRICPNYLCHATENLSSNIIKYLGGLG